MASGRKPPYKPTSKNNAKELVAQAKSDVADIEARIKQLRKHNREILKNSGKTVKEFRHEVAQLKKAGIVSKRVNAISQEPTKYMRGKVRKFFDVLVGTKQAVRAPKKVREEYESKGLFETRGPFIMVPKQHPKQRVSLDKKGRVKISTPIGPSSPGGRTVSINRIVLPFTATDMLDLANRIENSPELPDELTGAQQYGFSLFGHRSFIGFPTKQELVDYIKIRYQHLFSGKSGDAAVRHFNLVTYSGGSSEPPPGDWVGKPLYSKPGNGRRPQRPNATGRNYADTWYENRKRKVHAAQQKKVRERMTEEQRAEYNRKGKERAAKSRAAKKGQNND